MRNLALFLSLFLALLATARLPAQDPGAQQDAEAARQKLLKASDELENMQANSEATKISVDAMKADVTRLENEVTKLQADSAALRQQLADNQTALEVYKAEQLKARQTLIDNVADMIAASAAKTTKAVKKKKESTDEVGTNTSGPVKAGLAPPPDPSSTSTGSGDASAGPVMAPPPTPQKGYYHVVATGETLRLISEAFREEGVNVTVSAIRKANGLTPDSELKVGQKLFIPKPGT